MGAMASGDCWFLVLSWFYALLKQIQFAEYRTLRCNSLKINFFFIKWRSKIKIQISKYVFSSCRQSFWHHNQHPFNTCKRPHWTRFFCITPPPSFPQHRRHSKLTNFSKLNWNFPQLYNFCFRKWPERLKTLNSTRHVSPRHPRRPHPRGLIWKVQFLGFAGNQEDAFHLCFQIII